MKLVVLMSVEEYADQLRKIMKEQNVPVYSESELQGFKLHQEHQQDNWFSGRHLAVHSHIVFTFVDDEQADRVLDAIKNYSQECEKECPIRAFALAVDRAV